MFKKRTLAALSGAAVAGLAGVGAFAANPEPVDVYVQFVEPVTITENASLQFGLLDVGMASTQTITIAPDDTVSDPSGNLLNGNQNAASLTVDATAGEAINILVDNVGTPNYYTLGNFVCNYDGGADSTACDDVGGQDIATSVASATLTIGATLTKNGTPATAGTDDTTFDVTIVYQ